MAEESWDDIIAEAGDGFDLPPEGEYDFVITDAEAKVSKNSGNPMIATKAKIASGPHAGKGIKTFYVIRAVKTATSFMKHMNAVGISVEVLRQQKPTLEQIAKVMIGKQFRGEVVHKSDKQWGDSAELKWQMRAPESGAVAVTEFPVLTAADELGYSDDSGSPAMAIADDAGF